MKAKTQAELIVPDREDQADAATPITPVAQIVEQAAADQIKCAVQQYNGAAVYYEVHEFNRDGSVCMTFNYSPEAWRGYNERWAARQKAASAAHEYSKLHGAQIGYDDLPDVYDLEAAKDHIQQLREEKPDHRFCVLETTKVTRMVSSTEHDAVEDRAFEDVFLPHDYLTQINGLNYTEIPEGSHYRVYFLEQFRSRSEWRADSYGASIQEAKDWCKDIVGCPNHPQVIAAVIVNKQRQILWGTTKQIELHNLLLNSKQLAKSMQEGIQ